MSTDTLPQLPVVGYEDAWGDVWKKFADAFSGEAPPAELVRKSDAEAALRAQAEEMAALRADALRWRELDATLSDPEAGMSLNSGGWALLKGSIDDTLAATKSDPTPAELHGHKHDPLPGMRERMSMPFAATKQENPDA